MFGTFFTHFLPPEKPESSEPIPSNQPLTDEQCVLDAVATPITKGALSDRVGLNYRQLDPILHHLQATGQITTCFLHHENVVCLHFMRKHNGDPNRGL